MEKFLGAERVFRSKIRVAVKTKILESCFLPVMCHGAQTWALTNVNQKIAELQVKEQGTGTSSIKEEKKKRYESGTLTSESGLK